MPTTCAGAGDNRVLYQSIKEVQETLSRLPEEGEVAGRRVLRAGDAAYKARALGAVVQGRCAAGRGILADEKDTNRDCIPIHRPAAYARALACMGLGSPHWARACAPMPI